MFSDFVRDSAASTELIQKYRYKVPDEILEIWRQYGFGTFFDGYLKVINPEEYKELLKETYGGASNAIPLLVTAFGDIITLEKGNYVYLIQYRRKDYRGLIIGMNTFFHLLSHDKSFAKVAFNLPEYYEAREKYGPLMYDECFCYAPLPMMGGKAHVKNIYKGKIKEYIMVICDLIGGVAMD